MQKKITNLGIDLKLIFKDYVNLNEKELVDILNLRNQKNIRENMANDELISLENHLNWVKTLEKNENKRYFAIDSENEIVGSLSFVKDKKDVNWGVFFKNEINPFVSSASTFVFLDFLFLNVCEELYSYVKKENLKAASFNKSFGFKVYKEDEEYFYLNLQKLSWEKHKNSKLLKPIKNYLDKIEYIFEE